MRRLGAPFWSGAAFTVLAGVGIFVSFRLVVARGKDITASDAYALLPLFGVLGILCAILYRLLSRPLGFPASGLGFVMGCLAGGALAGALVLWIAASDRPFGNRLLISLFGGAMLGGFFPWIGALLMHASRQSKNINTL